MKQSKTWAALLAPLFLMATITLLSYVVSRPGSQLLAAIVSGLTGTLTVNLIIHAARPGGEVR